MDQREVCEFVRGDGMGGGLGGPVAIDADHLPAGIGAAEDISRAEAAAAAADHIEVDDGVFAIVGKLGQGKAEDEVIRGAVATGRVEVEDGVGLMAGDTDGFCQGVFFPEIRGAGVVDFLCEFVEDADGDRLEEMMFCPFVVVEFYEAAGVCAGDEKVMWLRRVDDGRVYGVDETLGGWGLAMRREVCREESKDIQVAKHTSRPCGHFPRR